MALKFRRGTTAQKSGSLAFGEPYVNTTLGTLEIGLESGDVTLSAIGTGSNIAVAGISGSSLDITGDAKIDGNLTLGGNITIGNATTDTISINADLSSSLIPDTTNTVDLGSSTKVYKTIYGNTLSGSVLEIMSGSNPELRLLNKTTGIQYHIQNGDGGNFQIHNANTDKLLFKFQSASFDEGNQDGYFYSDLYVSESVRAHDVYASHVASTSLTGSLSGSVFGIGNVLEYSSSVESKLSNLQTASASVGISIAALNSYTASNTSTTALNSFTASAETKFTEIGVVSGSLIATASNHEGRLDAMEAESSSYARTNSTNIFTGNQTITGSMFISGDMIVQGSSSLQNVSASVVSIGTNIVKLNTATPAVRFAGLQVIDSGSTQMSSSLYWDSINNHWIYQRESGAVYGGGMLISGPRNLGALGDEVGITNNRVVMGIGGDHISSSGMWTDGNNLSVPNNLEVSGSLTATLVGNASTADALKTSRTINGTIFDGTQNITILNLVSSSMQIDATLTNNFSSGVQTVINNNSIVSGSSQISFNGIVDKPTLVSGSSQISHNSTTGYSADRHIDHTAVTITAGSGLTGGGDISANRTLVIGAGSHIIVNPDDVAVNPTTLIPAISGTILSSITGDVTISAGGVASISANSVALGTDTTGNYVASLVAGTNITLSNNSGEGATPTIGLTNNTISGIALGSNLGTLTIGTGLSGTSYNGSAGVTIANTGVTSNVASTGISVSGATGAVTITNTGVTSAVAGTGVSVSGATGAVTISIGQAVATSSNVQFNSLGIGMAASATAGRIDATNDIVAFSSSDIRFKENIKAIENPIDKIRKISGNTYDWKAENKAEHGYEGNDVGVIAQEIEAVLPQLVQTRENGYKAVKYDKLVALLIEGIKEQQLQIEDLKIEVKALKTQKGL